MTEERDYVTYDELIHVLEEKPSGRIYIERDGMLCGLLTAGRIERRHEERTRRVSFNKKFSAIHPGEYSRVWQILREINEVPIVSEDGRLLGDYVRWSSSVDVDYVRFLCKDPYVLQGLKDGFQDIAFVMPSAGRDKLFSLWRQKLENEGVHLRVIHPWEIKDNPDVTYFMFADRGEMIGVEILNSLRHIFYDKKPRKFIML